MRKAEIHRKTGETDVLVAIDLDGEGESTLETPVYFLNHMLSLMSRHGLIDIKVVASGDTEVDYHHLVEDMGITLGEAIAKAVGTKEGITRYGTALIPMDETLAEVALDLSGRPYLVYHPLRPEGMVGDLPISLFEDFFQALAAHSRMNLHINVRYGRDLHHLYEAIFKAFGRALAVAVTKNERIKGVPSTKGIL